MSKEKTGIANKLSYLRLGITNKCNLACPNCHNEGMGTGNIDKSSILTAKDYGFLTRTAIGLGYKKIKISGGEPSLRPDFLDVVEAIGSNRPNDLSIITNGFNISKNIRRIKELGVSRVNISIYSADFNYFNSVQNGKRSDFTKALDAIESAASIGLLDKLNTVIQDKNDFSNLENTIKFVHKYDRPLVVLPQLGNRLSIFDVYDYFKERGIESEHWIADEFDPIAKKIIVLKNEKQNIILRASEVGKHLPYNQCSTCEKSSSCKEGISPIRVLVNGRFRACLAGGIPEVNALDIIKSRSENELIKIFKEFNDYLKERVDEDIDRDRWVRRVG
ncbi:MAG: radical SAM protein [Bacteriovoracaceae bacterium]|nr:radical SAM protein [Bacteriovoracaceae bacterium]